MYLPSLYAGVSQLTCSHSIRRLDRRAHHGTSARVPAYNCISTRSTSSSRSLCDWHQFPGGVLATLIQHPRVTAQSRVGVVLWQEKSSSQRQHFTTSPTAATLVGAAGGSMPHNALQIPVPAPRPIVRLARGAGCNRCRLACRGASRRQRLQLRERRRGCLVQPEFALECFQRARPCLA